MAVIGREGKKFRIPIILHDNYFLYGKIVPPPPPPPPPKKFNGTSSLKIMVVHRSLPAQFHSQDISFFQLGTHMHAGDCRKR